jgi:hypothetical protein
VALAEAIGLQNIGNKWFIAKILQNKDLTRGHR